MTEDTGAALSDDKIREVRVSFARQGLMRTIGATLINLAPGRCTIELPFSDAVSQQQGFFHGGIVATLADNAGGFAAQSLMPLGCEVVTLEYKVNFLRPAAGTRLIAVGAVLRAGRNGHGDARGRVDRAGRPTRSLRRPTAKHHNVACRAGRRRDLIRESGCRVWPPVASGRTEIEPR